MPTPLHPGLSSRREAETYADGECHYFALAVHERLGLPLAYVANRGADGRLHVGHVVLGVGDGLFADAEGVWAEADLLAHWGANAVVPTSRVEVIDDLGGSLSAHARRSIERAGRILAEDAGGYLGRLETLAEPVPPAPTFP